MIAVPFILLAVGIVSVAAPSGGEAEVSPALVVGGAALAAIIVLAVISIPFFLAGWGVLKRKSWGTVLAVITGILNLSNFPIGTAFGIYTFWAVIQGKLATG